MVVFNLILPVRAYHRSFYRPDNLCLVVAGQVEQERLFSVLAGVEAKIAKKGPLPPMQRPWCDFVTAAVLQHGVCRF